MTRILESPLVVFIVSLVAQWSAAYVGDLLRRRRRAAREDEREDLNTIQSAVLTLLAIIVGFSFSMAMTRYDQRIRNEEAEANAIGTEYVRANLLPAESATRVRELLKMYLDQRISFYQSRDQRQVSDDDTARLQAELWSAILPAAQAQPTGVTALAVSGMNDALNSQSYTQAAWLDRIPLDAWELMGLIAMSCNLLIGYNQRRQHVILLVVVPIVMAICFMLVADIDSPQGGIIRVPPRNLILLSQSMKALQD